MLAVVSHDAGGAEVVSSYLRQHPQEARFVLEGPAVHIFERKLGPLARHTLDEALHGADELLCGTSWQSPLEFDAIARARRAGVRSVAFLDHWQNYRDRFERDGVTALPDALWVGDEDAKWIATAQFPDTPVRLVPNPYFDDLRREMASFPARARSGDGVAVLYVAEPVREHGQMQFGDERHWGYVEEEALRYFLSHHDALCERIAQITIRPHPSERPNKYDWARSEFALPIVAGGARSLFEEIADADLVVGCESMALVMALLAGKRVISCIPPGGRRLALPHQGIESLSRLIEKAHPVH